MPIEIPLDAADEVVTACSFHDRILIFTRRGKIYEVAVSDQNGYPVIRLVS